MEAVGHLDDAEEAVGEPERRHACRGGEHGQAAREVPPELVIVVEVGELFLDRPDRASACAGLLELRGRLGSEVLELDPLCFATRRRVGRKVDRDARGVASREQPTQLGARRYVV
jgi:hypothetical protein